MAFLGTGTLIKWLDSGNAANKTVATADGNGHATWEDPNTLINTGLPVFSGSFFTASSPYIEYSSTAWKAIMQFPYIGSNTLVLTKIAIVASKSNANGSAHFRIIDLTNSTPTLTLVIAEITWTAEDLDTYVDDTLLNLPANSAEFEVQIRDVGATKPRLHSLMVF